MDDWDSLPMYEHRPEFRAHLVARVQFAGPWAEFGVASGRSAQHFLELMPAAGRLFAFDSWRGLPEPWDKGTKVMPVGTFAGNIPDFLTRTRRATPVVGLFEDTLPYEFPGPIALCHIDSDIYSAAATVLTHVDPYLAEGTVIIFDEIWNDGTYPTWEQGEYRALCEWRERTGKSVEWFCKTVGGAAGIVSEPGR